MGKCKITPILSMVVLFTLIIMLYVCCSTKNTEHFSNGNGNKRCIGNECDPIEGTQCVYKLNNKGILARSCKPK